jgi:U3 small nucleolar ribonucleoprotein component
LSEEKINQAFDKAYAEWKADANQQLKTAEDEEFEMIERQLSGWRKRQIEQKMESIEKYDPSKIFIQAGWYSKEQLTNLITKMDSHD